MRDFPEWLFEVGRCTLNLGHPSDGSPLKWMKKGNLCFWPAYPHCNGQVHLSRCWGITLLVYIVYFLGFQYKQKTSSSLEISGTLAPPSRDCWDIQILRTEQLLYTLPSVSLSGNSHCWISARACKALWKTPRLGARGVAEWLRTLAVLSEVGFNPLHLTVAAHSCL